MSTDTAMRRFQVYGTTRIGRVRRSNEDHILLGHSPLNLGDGEMEVDDDDPELSRFGLLFAVADGIGGEAGGAIASRMALSELESRFYAVEKTDGRPQAFIDALRSAAGRANALVLEAAVKEPRLARMGCTLTGVCLLPRTYLVFNVGDSRVYRFHGGELERLTRDDSMANLVVEAGAMTAEEAARSPIGHTLTNCLGSREFALAVFEGPPWRQGDRLLACSDGLYDMVADEHIAEILANPAPPEQQVERLAAAAMAGGGNDNISVILIAAESA